MQRDDNILDKFSLISNLQLAVVRSFRNISYRLIECACFKRYAVCNLVDRR